MIRLALTLTRAGGWPRMLLLGSCTALVCALLLVVVTIARLPANPDEFLFPLVAEPGLRGGTSFAIALLTLPPLLLLYQAVRLGTAARDRRLAALRLAGATPGEVRRLGALEVGLPAFVGSAAGIALFWLLRVLLGGDAQQVDHSNLKLVPSSVSPQWWAALLVVVATTLAGVLVGARASRGVIVTPLGVSRRQTAAPPRPWGLLLLVATIPALGLLDSASAVAPLVLIGLPVLSLLTLAPWAAYRVGRFASARAASPPVLLAARRLVADPRTAGRAAAAVGAIALVSGGGAGVAANLVAEGTEDAFYFLSLALGAVALMVALLVAISTLAVHSVESLMDRKRSVASLAALGMPLAELERAQRWEARLVALPMAGAGVLLGCAAMTGLSFAGRPGSLTASALLVIVIGVGTTLALVWLAIDVAVRATRPWAIRAASVVNLRTE